MNGGLCERLVLASQIKFLCEVMMLKRAFVQRSFRKLYHRFIFTNSHLFASDRYSRKKVEELINTPKNRDRAVPVGNLRQVQVSHPRDLRRDAESGGREHHLKNSY